MQLSHYNFLILLALSKEPAHGYALKKLIASDTGGSIILGPATLYTCLKQLDEAHLIEPIPLETDTRRRSYRLTRKGWDELNQTADSYLSISKVIPSRIG